MVMAGKGLACSVTSAQALRLPPAGISVLPPTSLQQLRPVQGPGSPSSSKQPAMGSVEGWFDYSLWSSPLFLTVFPTLSPGPVPSTSRGYTWGLSTQDLVMRKSGFGVDIWRKSPEAEDQTRSVDPDTLTYPSLYCETPSPEHQAGPHYGTPSPETKQGLYG